MKRGARIVYLVGAITSFVSAATVLTIGLVYTCLGAIALIQLSDASSKSGRVDIAPFIVFFVVGLALIALAIFPVISAVIAFGGRSRSGKESPDKGPHIASIVFGALTSSPFLIAGVVLSLIQINVGSRQKEPLSEMNE